MTTPAIDLLARSAELSRVGRAHAIATVVAIQRPTSARPGARGLVHADGQIEGWVGGSCAQPVVVREALRSLADGEPRLLRLSRTGTSDSRRGDGVIDYVMTCHSGGTLEIFVEPHLPAADLFVVGLTPIATALAELGAALGFRVTLVDPLATADGAPPGVRVSDDLELGRLEAPAPPWVIVATQGSWDEEAVEAALGRETAFIGLVASPIRAAAVRDYLRDAGVSSDRIDRLRSPVGLDIGARTPEEVALSILAELIAVRRGHDVRGSLPPATEPATAGPAGHPGHRVVLGSDTWPTDDAIDPVCGMTVERATARHIAEHAGEVYLFCSVGCRTRFARDPAAFVPPPA